MASQFSTSVGARIKIVVNFSKKILNSIRMSRQENFDKEKPHDRYNNSFTGKVRLIYNKQTTADICDTIYRKLTEHYRSNNRFECRTIARSFYWTLQDYVNPPFRPHFIQNRLALPEIDDDKIMILNFPVAASTYHYLTVCKSNTENHYRVYNAFGEVMIKAFDIEKETFRRSYQILQKMEPKHANVHQYIDAWNNVIHMDCEFFLSRKYLANLSLTVIDDLLEKFIEKIDPEYDEDVDDLDENDEDEDEDVDDCQNDKNMVNCLSNYIGNSSEGLKEYLEGLHFESAELTDMKQKIIILVDTICDDERIIIQMEKEEIQRRCGVIEHIYNGEFKSKKTLSNFLKDELKTTKQQRLVKKDPITLMIRE